MNSGYMTTLKKIYKKIRLSPDPDLFTIFFIISLASLSLGIYNNYIIRSGTVNVSNVGPDGKKVLQLKDLIKNVNPDSPRIGNPNAKVVIVEFEDFQCPFCKKFHNETFSQIKKEYVDSGKVLFIHQDLAFLGVESTSAAMSAHCARDQGKYWEFRDAIYEKQGRENSGVLSEKNLKTIAKNLNLDTLEFNECFDTKKYEGLVNETRDFAGSYGIRSTPTFIVNGVMIKGAQSIDSFRNIINSELED